MHSRERGPAATPEQFFPTPHLVCSRFTRLFPPMAGCAGCQGTLPLTFRQAGGH